MINFKSFYGIVTLVSDFMIGQGQDRQSEGCYKLITVENESGAVAKFVVSPTTYFVDQAIVQVGDWVTGYYDANAPIPYIYPPQYQALVIVKISPYQHVKVDYFNHQFVSSDGLLKLNLSPYVPIFLTNGQPFTGNPGNRNLIVLFGPVTRSIPAQTTPNKIIVWCLINKL